MTNLSSKNIYAIILGIFALYAVAWVLHLQLDLFLSFTDFMYEMSYHAVYILAALVAFWGARNIGSKNKVGKALKYSGIAMVLYIVGLWIWIYYESILQVEVPYPSVADYAWILMTLFQTLATISLIYIYSPRINFKLVVSGIIVFIAAFLSITYVLGFPELGGVNFVTTFTNWYYAISDSVLITLAFMTLFSAGGKIFSGLFFYVLGLLTLAAADIFFAIRIENGTYFDGDFSDRLFLMAGAIFAISFYNIGKKFIKNA